MPVATFALVVVFPTPPLPEVTTTTFDTGSLLTATKQPQPPAASSFPSVYRAFRRFFKFFFFFWTQTLGHQPPPAPPQPQGAPARFFCGFCL